MTEPFERPAVSKNPNGRRVVIVHYHLFKNAGTSIDRALKAYCDDRWTLIEADHGDRQLTTEAVRALIDSRPELLAISSHTAPIEPHLIGEDLNVIPIVFLRHPIDRMRSAYDFERKQGADTLGSRTARMMPFPDYLSFFLQHPRARNFKNFQAHRLAKASPLTERSMLECALDALDRIPFVGAVECFEASIRKYECLIQAQLPGFRLAYRHDNQGGRSNETISARLEEIRNELTPSGFEEAMQNNLADLLIWERAYWRAASP